MNSVELAKSIRKKSLELAYRARASHLGGALSVADVLAVLYTDVLKYRANEPRWPDRDRFFYSKGHACTVYYSLLHELGFFSSLDDAFSKDGSYFTTHINHKIPGVEWSTGSLGHALSVSCGVALAARRGGKSYRVFTVVSDGELDEGSNWEALLFAGHHGLANLTLIVDYNKIQSLGAVSEVLDIEPLADKFQSFRWSCRTIDGHDHNAIRSALQSAPYETSKPSVIIANTVKGAGVDFMEHQLAWHYKSPSLEQLDDAINQIDRK